MTSIPIGIPYVTRTIDLNAFLDRVNREGLLAEFSGFEDISDIRYFALLPGSGSFSRDLSTSVQPSET